MRRVLAWTGILLLSLCAGLGVRAEEAAPGDGDLTAAIAFFDRLELPDPAAHRWVRVWAGQWRQQGGEAPAQSPRGALLLADAGETFQVLWPDLGVGDFEKTTPDTEAHRRVAFEEAPFEAYVPEELARLRAADGSPYSERGRTHRFGPHLPESGETAVLAWMCAKRGLGAEAQALWDLGARIHPVAPYLAAVMAQVEATDLWRIVEAFGDPEIPLTTIRDRLRRHVRVFRKTALLDRARIMEEALSAQLAEKPVPKPAADAPVAGRVAYLVDQLPTQHGQQPGQPARCNPFNDERGEESPAHQLVAIGYDAVPALLDALYDLRFTRSIGYVRDFYFSHHVLRVSDVALDVLQHIAGRSFWDPPYFSEHVSQEERNVRVQVAKRAAAWWAEAAAKGEIATLEEEVAQGGRTAPILARRLLDKDAARGLAALRRALVAAAEPRTRGYLVKALRDVESLEATEIVRTVLRDDASLLVRATAAHVLLAREPEVAIVAMTDDWRRTQSEADAGVPFSRTQGGLRLCREFLQGCGDVRGIQALAAGLDAAPVKDRVELLTGLRWSGSSVPFTLRQPGVEQKRRAPPEVLEAVEALLVDRLADRDAYPISLGLYSSLYDRFIEPRVCDFAAWVLGELFPNAYAPFAPATPVRVRDHRIAEMQNVRRVRRGEPAVALPPLEEAPAMGGQASRVAEVQRAGVEDQAWGDVAPMLDALDGRDLTAVAVIDVVLAAIEHLDETVNSFRLHIHRDEPHLGIVVRARLEPRVVEAASHAARIRVGTETVHGHSGSGVRSYVTTRRAWVKTEQALAAMLAAPVDRILDAKIDVNLEPDRK